MASATRLCNDYAVTRDRLQQLNVLNDRDEYDQLFDRLAKLSRELVNREDVYWSVSHSRFMPNGA